MDSSSLIVSASWSKSPFQNFFPIPLSTHCTSKGEQNFWSFSQNSQIGNSEVKLFRQNMLFG